MSYILDALKKDQANANSDGAVAINPGFSVAPRRPAWVWVLVAALVINMGLVGWLLWSAGQPAAVQYSPAPATQPVQTAQPPQTAPAIPPPVEQATELATPPAAQTARPVMRKPAIKPPPAPLQQVHVSQLSPRQRTLFETFSYTSHIYTDEVALRAIVIDGQKLTTGDRFKDMTIHEITETGVVFKDTRNTPPRLIAVTPFE